jgi:acid stress-induced BolA-like protein IbaG/YrbA
MTAEATLTEVRDRIEAAIPGCTVDVRGGGGHFEIDVIAEQFEGLNTLKKQRMVYSAIKDLMSGDDAPVHAVDRLGTRTPAQAG